MSVTTATRHRPLTGRNFASDAEIMAEIGELLADDVGDIRYGTVFVDRIRHQITGKLEDGRVLRLTVMFE